MNKYIRYMVFGCAAVLWFGFMLGFVLCANSFPKDFVPDDLHLACFGVGLCGLPFLAGFGYVSYLAADLICPLFCKKNK